MSNEDQGVSAELDQEQPQVEQAGDGFGSDAQAPAESSDSTVEVDQVLSIDALGLQAAEFKLLNLYLVDSLSQGRIVNMRLDGGAVITGRNGRGKTSMLQVLPLFYGCKPIDLVQKGKDSFIGYYLPNTTSYIVFEYQRDDGGKRLVVAYSNSTEDKVFYRFVRSGYDPRFFINDQNQFVPSKYLRTHLGQLGVSYAEHQIETYDDYKAIIQFDHHRITDKKSKDYIRRIASDYAFTRYNRSLRHIDKLALGMFSRKANFEDLQTVVADCVNESQGSKSISAERRKLEEWPRDYRAYMRVMSIKPQLELANEKHIELTGVEKALGEIKEKMARLAEHLYEQERQQRANASQIRDTQHNEHAQHLEAAQALSSLISKAEDRVSNLRNQIEGIEKQAQAYAEQDVEGKRVQSAQREIFEQDLAQAKARLDGLTGAYAEINARFTVILNRIDTELNAFKSEATESVGKIHARLQQELILLAEQFAEREAALENAYTQQRETLTLQDRALREQLGSVGAQVKQPQIDSLLIQQLSDKEAEFSEARDAVAEVVATIGEIEGKKREATGQLEQLGRRKSVNEQEIASQRQRIDQIKLAHSPAPDTLLAFLRENHAQWGSTIGKVIQPDLLLRSDLQPHLEHMSDSLYGLTLALGELDSLPEADQSVMEGLLNDASEVLARLEAQLAQAVEGIEQQQALIAGIDKQLNDARGAKINASSRMQVVEGELKTLRKRVETARAEAQAQAQVRYDELTASVKASEQAINDLERKYRFDRQALGSEHTQQKTRAQNVAGEHEQQIKLSVQQRESECARNARECKAECNKALAEQGADVAMIDKLKGICEGLEKNLKDIRSWEPLLAEYQVWKSQVLIHLEDYREEADVQAAQCKQYTDKLEQAKAQWAVTDERYSTMAVEAEAQAEGFKTQADIANQCFTGPLDNFIATELYSAVDPAWDVKALQNDMVNRINERKKFYGELVQKIGQIRAGFMANPNSPPAEYFQGESQLLDSEKPLDQLKLFNDWFTHKHADRKRILITEANTIYAEVSGFHRALKHFSERITRFNTELQAHLTRGSQVFDSITDLKVSVVSTVDELEYWPIVNRLVNSSSEWLRIHDALPDETFVDNLTQLLSYWEMKEGISASFKSMVNIRGEVTENGNVRMFRRSKDLDNVSSNGLSYLVLVIIFLAFMNKIRGDSPVRLLWGLDELKAIDAPNVLSLHHHLEANSISLATAFPDPDAETLMLFENTYTVDQQRRLVSVVIGETMPEEGVA